MIVLASSIVLYKTSTLAIHVNPKNVLQYWQLAHDEWGKPTGYLVSMPWYDVSKSFIIAKEKPESHIEEQTAIFTSFHFVCLRLESCSENSN